MLVGQHMSTIALHGCSNNRSSRQNETDDIDSKVLGSRLDSLFNYRQTPFTIWTYNFKHEYTATNVWRDQTQTEIGLGVRT